MFQASLAWCPFYKYGLLNLQHCNNTSKATFTLLSTAETKSCPIEEKTRPASGSAVGMGMGRCVGAGEGACVGVMVGLLVGGVVRAVGYDEGFNVGNDAGNDVGNIEG